MSTSTHINLKGPYNKSHKELLRPQHVHKSKELMYSIEETPYNSAKLISSSEP